ncbi:dynamin family protein [Amphibiibacter pelophylacis]|uniref:Dynamin family protein n=1 Tax=Amphibiibacter pelophylacis TaxID=1799477 RepID=A0ACC6P3V6_9BURK
MKTELFPPVLMAYLYKLGNLFIRRRKQLREDVIKIVQAADNRYGELTQEYKSVLARTEVLTADFDELTKCQANTAAELEDARNSLHGLQQTLEQASIQHGQSEQEARLRFGTLSLQYAELMQDRNRIEKAREVLRQQLDQVNLDLQATVDSLSTMDHRHKILTQEHQKTLEFYEKLTAKHEQVAAEFHELSQRHGDTWTRFQLISQLLAACPRENAGLVRFRKLLANDYMTFADHESSLAAEAKALTMLQSIQQELALFVGFPDVNQRTIVGIVGGFSSGKSEFVNSFIGDPEVRLAVGMQPITAIPSYVLASDERIFRGYSANGGYVNLELDFYKKITHAFIDSFGFDLKGLMPFMCVGVQMDPEYFANICFIDTPGYNSPATAAAQSHGDRRTAIQFARQADVLVWLIALDSNGTVPDSDIDFIQQIGVEQQSIYVVLTKADLKSDDDINYLIDEVDDILQSYGIAVCGISAYSSTRRAEVAYRKVALMKFFSQINKSRNVIQRINGRLREVFSMYDDAIQQDIEIIRSQKRAINGLRLDCLEIGGIDVYERMLVTIDMLEEKLDVATVESWLKESRRLSEEFSDAVRQTVEVAEEKASVV